MSLDYAILGLLNVIPMTGYDLKHRAFAGSVQHFWPADQSQIYRTLKRLQERKWVNMEVDAQEARPDRKVYTITEAGRKALSNWLQESQIAPIIRDPLIVQLFFGMEIPNEDLLKLIEERLTHHRQQIEAYDQIPIPPLEQQSRNRWLALQHLTLAFGIQLEQCYISWLEQARKTIARIPQPEDSDDFRANFQ